jgi:diaminopimelate epimerase
VGDVRARCDVDPDQFSAIQPLDDEGVEQVEADSWNNDKSMAAMSGAWLRSKVRHPWLGGPVV